MNKENKINRLKELKAEIQKIENELSEASFNWRILGTGQDQQLYFFLNKNVLDFNIGLHSIYMMTEKKLNHFLKSDSVEETFLYLFNYDFNSEINCKIEPHIHGDRIELRIIKK